MLTIDRSNPNTRFIVTQSEVYSTPAVILDILNRATNREYSYELPDDTSPYPDRFNEYLFDTNVFSGLTQGLYSFTMKDEAGVTKERGLLQVNVDSTPYSVDDGFVSLSSTTPTFYSYTK